ncbi:VOC family protein [Georgenia wangjunii]|uniref:VOC family protein n=1 Tax=Georgenia wangjunii TaxID=3117730 RepID=UPI002F25FCCD
MSHLEVSNVLSGLAVSDMETATDWMSRVIGRPADARPMDGLADWQLQPHGTLQLVLDPDRAGGSMVTLHVPDIAATQAQLAERGLDLQYDDTTSIKVKFGELIDPDGNSITIVEALPGFDPSASD